MIRVIVCGGRHYEGSKEVNTFLNDLKRSRGIAVVIEGGASGADRLGRKWAQAHDIPVETYNAKWRNPDGSTDYSAGPKRNTLMLEEGKPDVVVAFPGGNGTADMVAKARAAGVEVIVYGQGQLFD